MSYEKYKDYTVLQDSREQKGWMFEPYQKCLGTEITNLKYGDYTIKGLEDYLCIERKASASEIANNLGKEKERFHREMDRMFNVKHKYIICEFSCSQLLRFPEGAGIPASKLKIVKMTGKLIMKHLLELQMQYNVNVLFCDNAVNAFTTASSIIKRINEKYGG